MFKLIFFKTLLSRPVLNLFGRIYRIKVSSLCVRPLEVYVYIHVFCINLSFHCNNELYRGSCMSVHVFWNSLNKLGMRGSTGSLVGISQRVLMNLVRKEHTSARFYLSYDTQIASNLFKV